VLPLWIVPIQAYCYEVHERFGYLKAPSVKARLQLAALYAATSSLLPEPKFNMTGAEIALTLGKRKRLHDHDCRHKHQHQGPTLANLSACC
jgi:hypothetical protein